MDPRDDADLGGDETLDWLWDLDDRYDVGSIDDDPTGGSGLVPGGPAGSGVKKHLRKPRVLVGAGAPGAVELSPDESEKNTAAGVVARYGSHAGPASSLRDRLIRDGRLTGSGIAAAIVLVVALGGMAYAMTGGSGDNHPSHVAISPTTPTTLPSDSTTQPPTGGVAATPTTTPPPVTPTGTSVYSAPNVATTVCNRMGRLLSLVILADTTTTTIAPATTTTTAPATTTTTARATTVPTNPPTTPRQTIRQTTPPPPPPPPPPTLPHRVRGC